MRPLNRRSLARFVRRVGAGAALGAIAFLATTIGPAAPSAEAAPQPDPVPTRWEFRIEPGELRVGAVETEEGSRAFYYLTYTVTNEGQRSQYLAPLFELATDEGEVIRSGRDVPPEAVTALLTRIDNPLLLDEVAIQGPLPTGRVNARQGLVVWAAGDLDPDEVRVFAAGFSGETKTVLRPDNGERVVLRKSLMLVHGVPGEIDPGPHAPLQRTDARWIMR